MQKSAGGSQSRSLFPANQWDGCLALLAPCIPHAMFDATTARRATRLLPLPSSGRSPLHQDHNMLRSTPTQEAPSSLSPTAPAVASSPDSPQGWAGTQVPRTLRTPLRCDDNKFNQRSQWPFPFTEDLGWRWVTAGFYCWWTQPRSNFSPSIKEETSTSKYYGSACLLFILKWCRVIYNLGPSHRLLAKCPSVLSAKAEDNNIPVWFQHRFSSNPQQHLWELQVRQYFLGPNLCSKDLGPGLSFTRFNSRNAYKISYGTQQTWLVEPHLPGHTSTLAVLITLWQGFLQQGEQGSTCPPQATQL